MISTLRSVLCFYPPLPAGQTKAPESIHLPRIAQRVGLGTRSDTQVCLVPWEPLGIPSHGGGEWHGGPPRQSHVHFCRGPLWSALPLLAGGSYSLQVAQQEAGSDRCADCLALSSPGTTGCLVQDLLDSASHHVPSPTSRQIGFQSVPHHSEWVLLFSPPLPRPPPGLPAEPLRGAGGGRLVV